LKILRENFDLILLLKFCGGGGGGLRPPHPLPGVFGGGVFPSLSLPLPPPPPKKKRGKGGRRGGGRRGNAFQQV